MLSRGPRRGRLLAPLGGLVVLALLVRATARGARTFEHLRGLGVGSAQDEVGDRVAARLGGAPDAPEDRGVLHVQARDEPPCRLALCLHGMRTLLGSTSNVKNL